MGEHSLTPKPALETHAVVKQMEYSQSLYEMEWNVTQYEFRLFVQKSNPMIFCCCTTSMGL